MVDLYRNRENQVSALVHKDLQSHYAAMPELHASPETLSLLRDYSNGPIFPIQARPAPQPQKVVIDTSYGPLELVLIDARPNNVSKPAILRTYSGGYIRGYPMDEGGLVQTIAETVEGLVVSPHFPSAPEAIFPHALDVNYAALQWLYRNAAVLGVDRGRIGLLGRSSGGGHAASLAIKARDQGEIPLAYQMLIYPMLDDRTGSSRQVPPHIGQRVWSAQSNVFGWSAYLGQSAGLPYAPSGAVPARTENLAGLPPTYIAVGSLDLFVEENIDFARRLIASGVSTELQVVPGAFHAFDLIAPGTGVSQAFTSAYLSALRQGLRAG